MTTPCAGRTGSTGTGDPGVTYDTPPLLNDGPRQKPSATTGYSEQTARSNGCGAAEDRRRAALITCSRKPAFRAPMGVGTMGRPLADPSPQVETGSRSRPAPRQHRADQRSTEPDESGAKGVVGSARVPRSLCWTAHIGRNGHLWFRLISLAPRRSPRRRELSDISTQWGSTERRAGPGRDRPIRSKPGSRSRPAPRPHRADQRTTEPDESGAKVVVGSARVPGGSPACAGQRI
jgi:hypothetical protein